MLQRTAVKREFTFNGLSLKDPSPDMNQNQVMDYYANIYPELTTAKANETINKDGSFTYEFVTDIKTKG